MNIGIYARNIDLNLRGSKFKYLIFNELFDILFSARLYIFLTEKSFFINETATEIHKISFKNTGYPPLNTLLHKRFLLPAQIKKLDISALILFDPGDSSPVKVPQFLVLDENYASPPEDNIRLKKMAVIIVSSTRLKNKLIESFRVSAEKIIVINGLTALNDKEISFEEKTAFKDQITEGKEFFMYSDMCIDHEKMVLLLKAFSQFKKMQKSGWKLLIPIHASIRGEITRHQLSVLQTYKFRNDVILYPCVSTDSYFTATETAYACITLFNGMGFPSDAGAVLRCGTPLIAPESMQQSMPGFNLVLFQDADSKSLADKMMELYKNENLRKEMNGNSRTLSVAFKPETGIQELKKRLLQA